MIVSQPQAVALLGLAGRECGRWLLKGSHTRFIAVLYVMPLVQHGVLPPPYPRWK